MSKNRIGVPSGNPFGLSFDAEIDPALKLSPAELTARMEQGFSVTSSSRKPKKNIKPATPALGKIKVPAGVVVPTKRQLSTLRRSKPVSKPKQRPPEPMKPRTRTGDIMNVRREGDTFMVEPVDMADVARRAALAKIVNRRIPTALKQEFLTKLKANQDAVARFLVLEVATFDLAVPTGLEIAGEYLNDVTDAGPTVDLGRVQKMLPYITELKTLLFLCDMCGLSKAHTQLLVQNMVSPESPKAVDPAQVLAKMLQANRAQQPQAAPAKPTRRDIREQRESKNRTDALLRALRG